VIKDMTGHRPPSSWALKVVWTSSRPPVLPPGPWKYEFDAHAVTVAPDGSFEIPSYTKTKAWSWELRVAASFETVPPAPVYKPEWASTLEFDTKALGVAAGGHFADALETVYLMSDRTHAAKVSLASGRPLREYIEHLGGFQQIILKVTRRYRDPDTGRVTSFEQVVPAEQPEDGVYTLPAMTIPAPGGKDLAPALSVEIRLTHSYHGRTLLEKRLEDTSEEAVGAALGRLVIDDAP
jgi:hypothetical protein